MSFPLIRNIEAKNKNSKFLTYADSLTASAKLYVDAYGEDLFGRESSGCAYIKYSDLKNKMLTKDIQLNDVSCNSENTFVKVVKIKNQYGYSTYLGCGDKVGDKVEKVTITYPEQNKVYSIDSDECKFEESNISISASPNNSLVYNSTKKTTKIVINSPTGIHTNRNISYAWSNSNDYNSVTTWNKLNINIPSNAVQKEKVLKAENVVAESMQLTTPEGGNGSYYLFVKIDGLQDLVGKSWVNKENIGRNYVVFGPYNIDNSVPNISNVNIASTTGGYNNLNVKVNVSATDSYTPTDSLRYCVSLSSGSCNSYRSSTSTYSLNVGGKYDGGTRTVYVSVKDLAGNVSKRAFRYSVYKECTSTKSDDKWANSGSCSTNCGPGTVKQTSGSLDIYTGAKCSKTFTRNSTCNVGICRPEPPKITNPYSGKWATSSARSIRATTATKASEIGSWYYGFNTNSYTRFGGSGASSVVLPTISGASGQTKNIYVKVCNTAATSVNDTANCSAPAKTTVSFDSSNPSISSITVNSMSTGFNSLNVVVRVGANDTGSGIEGYCISESRSCDSYTSSSTRNLLLPGSLDGGTRIIWVSVKDRAGNIASTSYAYRVYGNCSTVFRSYVNAGPCSCNTRTMPQRIEIRDRYTGTVCEIGGYRNIECSPSGC